MIAEHIDPDLNDAVVTEDRKVIFTIAVEICEPVEADASVTPYSLLDGLGIRALRTPIPYFSIGPAVEPLDFE